MKKIFQIILATGLFFFASCGQEESSTDITTENVKVISTPTFDENKAYQNIEKQVSFGPRIPGQKASKDCALWLEEQLKQYCDTLYIQNATVEAKYLKKQLPCINLMGSINPTAKQRILLLSHWDTRPWADAEDKTKPMDGADDGASGVGVLLEIARLCKGQLKNAGIDILFVDCEDYGSDGEAESWCLGSEYWSKNIVPFGYKANYGILLDMVGASNPSYGAEGNSKAYAENILFDVFSTAWALGYQNNFNFNNPSGFIQDDHMPLNKNAGIPTIDLINMPGGNFPTHHHTTKDNMQIIDRLSLKLVGNLLMQVIYKEDVKQGAIHS